MPRTNESATLWAGRASPVKPLFLSVDTSAKLSACLGVPTRDLLPAFPQAWSAFHA